MDSLDSSTIYLNVSNERNQNLSAAQKEYFHIHRLYYHAHGQWIQELMRPRKFKQGGQTILLSSVLKTKHKNARSCKLCSCVGYLLGKMGRRSIDSSREINLKEMELREGALEPGARVFIDQYESSVLECR